MWLKMGGWLLGKTYPKLTHSQTGGCFTLLTSTFTSFPQKSGLLTTTTYI